jgi:hypothetical protein
MAEMQLQGINLGYQSKEYDFTDESGARRQGVSHSLHLLCGVVVHRVRVPDEWIERAKALPLNQSVTVAVTLPASVRLSLAGLEVAKRAASV